MNLSFSVAASHLNLPQAGKRLGDRPRQAERLHGRRVVVKLNEINE
jgi:hypothetical protein